MEEKNKTTEEAKVKMIRKPKTKKTAQEIKDVNVKNRFDNTNDYYKTKKRFIN